MLSLWWAGCCFKCKSLSFVFQSQSSSSVKVSWTVVFFFFLSVCPHQVFLSSSTTLVFRRIQTNSLTPNKNHTPWLFNLVDITLPLYCLAASPAAVCCPFFFTSLLSSDTTLNTELERKWTEALHTVNATCCRQCGVRRNERTSESDALLLMHIVHDALKGHFLGGASELPL